MFAYIMYHSKVALVCTVEIAFNVSVATTAVSNCQRRLDVLIKCIRCGKVAAFFIVVVFVFFFQTLLQCIGYKTVSPLLCLDF